jgi:heme/copper-type cytochrome/quinol oxidase subunit 2
MLGMGKVIGSVSGLLMTSAMEIGEARARREEGSSVGGASWMRILTLSVAFLAVILMGVG